MIVGISEHALWRWALNGRRARGWRGPRKTPSWTIAPIAVMPSSLEQERYQVVFSASIFPYEIRLALKIYLFYLTRALRKNGVRLAQKMHVGPRIPVGVQRERAGVGPASGPTRRLSHLGRDELVDARVAERLPRLRPARPPLDVPRPHLVIGGKAIFMPPLPCLFCLENP